MHLATHLDLDLVAVQSAGEVCALLELTAPVADAQADRPPRTLVVVLDRSGSMAAGALEAAKAGLRDVLAQLDPRDRLGLVCFDSDVEVVRPARALDDKDALRAAIDALQPGSSTNLSGGLVRGIQLARDAAGDAGATVVLLSDGHANVGVTDHATLASVATAAREHRITIHAIGVGVNYDEVLLDAVARGGTGNVHFAEHADAVGGALRAEADGLLAQVAEAATLAIRPKVEGATITVWNDLPSHGDEHGVTLEVGSLWSGETRKLVVTVAVESGSVAGLGLATLAELELRWVELPSLTTHTVTAPLSVNVVPGDEAAGRIPDPVVRSELAFQRAQRVKRQAADELRRGDTDAAAAQLGGAAGALRDAASAMPASPMLDELLGEADTLDALALEGKFAGGFGAGAAAKRAWADANVKGRKRGR